MAGLIHVGAWDGREYIGDRRRLLLFEPQAKPFALLSRNFAGHLNVELVNAAVGATVGQATMHVFEPSHSSSLLKPRLACRATEAVRMVTLDQWLKGREGYGTLRIDTQGYELEVLRGAPNTMRRMLKRVELELHDPSSYPGAATLADLDAFMEEQGWARTGVDVKGSDGLGDVVYEKGSE